MKQIKRIGFCAVMMLVIASALVSGQEGAAPAEKEGSDRENGPSEYLAFSAQSQILVADREAAAQALVEWVEESGGYFTEKSLEAVVLKVPAELFPQLRETVQERADDVVSYNVNAYDLRQELSSVQAALTSREENLQRVLTFLDSADVEGTLALEQEIFSLMREIERLKGRGRVLRNRMAYAEAYIQLSSAGTSIPVKRPSSFAWINTIDLYSFLEEKP